VCTTPLVPDDNARLFLALWPAPRVRAALLEYRDAWRWNTQASLVRPDKLHLTLHFIGNVPRHRLQQLKKGLEVPFEPFELNFGQPGLWRHGLAVLQPHAIPSSLLQLHGALRQALQRLELPSDTLDFRPHITLARRAVGAVPPAQDPVLCWQVHGYALMESMREPAGQYCLVQRYA
jgi:2'-5' RNA ligase